MVNRLDSPSVYTDLNGLNAISNLGRSNTSAGLRKVAEQFESMFINMMLKSMRESNSSLFEDNYLSSNEMSFHQENLDNQLSQSMSSAGGIGLADTLYRQMLGRFDVQESSTDALRETALRHPVKRRPAEAATVTAEPDTSFMEGPQEFVSRLMSIAKATAQRLGLDPRMLLAQSALETGWGRAIPTTADGRSSFNLFGVKADERWNGDQVSISTLEFRDGVMQRERASFRAYDSFEESFSDYVNFLQTNPRYGQALTHAGDAEAFAAGLQQAGYATDPDYARKLGDIMNSPLLRDAVAPEPRLERAPIKAQVN